MKSFRDDGEERRALLAAMLGVYASAVLGQHGDAQPAGLRTMSVPDAIATIKNGKGPLCERARRVAAARLAVSALHDGRKDLERALVDLLGPAIVRSIGQQLGGTKGPTPVSTIMATVYELLGGHEASHAALDQPDTQCSFDIRTMATTVDVLTVYDRTFDELAVKLDPRSWTSSPFWLAATKVIRVDGRFVKDPDQPPLGQSWSGYFYESVEWATDACVYSAFESYLNVVFRVEPPERIDLSFSLYSAAGSMVLARIAGGGIDIDSGYSRATRLLGEKKGGGLGFEVRARKRVRFTDVVSRDTPNQGPSGAGQGLNCMSPAVVAVWMNDILYENLNYGA